MEKKYRILRETMGSLKRVRESCVRFEELLEGSVCENGDLGEKISDHELGELYLGLSQITREAELGYISAQQRFEAREAEIRGEGATNQPGSANQQRFGGSIKAENLSVEINPTVVIQGEQVFIGQGSVNEFGAELQSLLLTSVNDAIENREIDLSNVSDRG